MRMKRNRVISSLLLSSLILAASVPVSAADQPEDGVYKIGVVVYDPDSQEMGMFMNYFKDYLEEGFPVKFFFSDKTYTAEEENAFISRAKEEGAKGIISFLGVDVESTVNLCEENEMYYVLGSNILSDEDYELVKDNPWFLGTVGAKMEDVYQSGRNMAEYFLDTDAQSFVIMTGGAVMGNSLHAARAKGMLDVFEEKAGLILTDASDKLALTEENLTLTNEDGTVTVTLCPELTEGGNGLENLAKAFDAGPCDVLMSAFHASTYLDKISAKEEEQGSNIMVGAIDSFTETNFEAIKEEDAFGNSKIDYVEGKYASMAGPSFAMMYNAVTGHPETNTQDGEAVRLYQGFWRADSREKYIELYGYTTGIYENAYSCNDLMQVIKVFNDDASPEKLKELTEAYTVDDVKERILGQ